MAERVFIDIVKYLLPHIYPIPEQNVSAWLSLYKPAAGSDGLGQYE